MTEEWRWEESRDRELMLPMSWDGGDSVELFMVSPMNAEAIGIITGIDLPGDCWYRYVMSGSVRGY